MVTICVCTYKRPKMLAACLKSIAEQHVPMGLTVHVLVVDNDVNGSARSVAAEYPGFTYVIEPKRGIAAARNRALDIAGGEWIAFIDDDEIADIFWISELMRPEYLSVPVLQGRQVFMYPTRASFWCVEKRKRIRLADEFAERKTAATNNVRFSAELVRAGLRFDETIGLMGGEDIDFFGRARAAGFGIRFTNLAVTYEVMHPERLGYWQQVYRAYWCAAADMRAYHRTRGVTWTWTRKGHTVVTSATIGVIELLVSPLFIAGGLTAFKRRALAGGKKIGKAAGRAAGLLGMMPTPYAHVVGY